VQTPPTTSRLERVLILEDEAMVSLMMEDLLRGMGAQAVDVFAAAADAMRALSSGWYDCAVLDVLLRDGTSSAVADELPRRGIPFMFSSAVGAEFLEPRHRSRPLLAKPFDDSALRARVLQLLGEPGGTAEPSPCLPKTPLAPQPRVG
jgi:DNA-binding response OmpR family regulator